MMFGKWRLIKNLKSSATFRLAEHLFFVVQAEQVVVSRRDLLADNQQGFFLRLPGPGTYPLPENRGVLEIECLEKNGKEAELQARGDKNCEIFDAESISFPLVLRSWQPGDVFFPLGMAGRRKKVKNFFTDCKVPLERKHSIPILCHDQRIVWIAGYRLDERFAVASATKKFMKVSYHAEQYT
jgi:tRNA(Ile)-lysidine synthetase-like protein